MERLWAADGPLTARAVQDGLASSRPRHHHRADGARPARAQGSRRPGARRPRPPLPGGRQPRGPRRRADERRAGRRGRPRAPRSPVSSDRSRPRSVPGCATCSAEGVPGRARPSAVPPRVPGTGIGRADGVWDDRGVEVAALGLLVLGVALAEPVSRALAAARWPARDPVGALLVWQAVGLAGGLALVGAGVVYGLAPLGRGPGRARWPRSRRDRPRCSALGGRPSPGLAAGLGLAVLAARGDGRDDARAPCGPGAATATCSTCSPPRGPPSPAPACSTTRRRSRTACPAAAPGWCSRSARCGRWTPRRSSRCSPTSGRTCGSATTSSCCRSSRGGLPHRSSGGWWSRRSRWPR